MEDTNKNVAENTHGITELRGLPQEFQEHLTGELLDRYIEVMGEEKVSDKLEAYKHKFLSANTEDQKRMLQNLKFSDKNIRDMDKLKKVLQEGGEYYDNSSYGRIKKAGGEQAYIKQLEEENKYYRSLENKKTTNNNNENSRDNYAYRGEEKKYYKNTVDTFDDDMFGSVNEMRQFFQRKRG